MIYTALTVTKIQSMPRGNGTEIHIEIPESAAPVWFDFSHAALSTRELIVWMRDPAQIQTPDETPIVEIFGVFPYSHCADMDPEPCRVRLETWFEEMDLADLIEGSEFLAQRGLHFTVVGREGSIVPG